MYKRWTITVQQVACTNFKMVSALLNSSLDTQDTRKHEQLKLLAVLYIHILHAGVHRAIWGWLCLAVLYIHILHAGVQSAIWEWLCFKTGLGNRIATISSSGRRLPLGCLHHGGVIDNYKKAWPEPALHILLDCFLVQSLLTIPCIGTWNCMSGSGQP